LIVSVNSVLTLANEPADQVRALADRVRIYQHRYEEARDERAIFACVYTKITSDLAQQLTQPGCFVDPAWVATLAQCFAERFMAAMNTIDMALEQAHAANRRELSSSDLAGLGPWADVYLAVCNGRGYVFESLIFSMMAHISYDLPQALLVAGQTSNGTCRIYDYHRMNDVLGGQIDVIERLVATRYQPFLRTLSKWAGRFGTFFTNYGIRSSRSVAWYNSDRLNDPTSTAEAMMSIRRSTASFIGVVRRPPEWLLRLLVKTARAIIPRRHKWPEPINVAKSSTESAESTFR
jgi:Family of unknown function (DUF5995)